MCWPFFSVTDEVIVEERRPRSWNEPRHKRLRHVRRHKRNSGDSDEWALTTRSMSRRLNQQEMWDLRKWEAQQRFNDAELRRHAIHNRFEDIGIRQEDQQQSIRPARSRRHPAVRNPPESYNKEQALKISPQWSDQAIGQFDHPHQRHSKREEIEHFEQNNDIQRVEDFNQDHDRKHQIYKSNSRPRGGHEGGHNGIRGVNLVHIEPKGTNSHRDVRYDGVQDYDLGHTRGRTPEYNVHGLHQTYNPAFVETHKGRSRLSSRPTGGDGNSMYMDDFRRPARSHLRPQRW